MAVIGRPLWASGGKPGMFGLWAGGGIMNADVLKAAYYAMAAVVREAKGRAAMARANGLVWADEADEEADLLANATSTLATVCQREGVDVR